MQGKFDANGLLCHNKSARREENKKCVFEQKEFFLLLNEYIVMLLKFKKKFHKYLSTCMLHSKLRKERG